MKNNNKKQTKNEMIKMALEIASKSKEYKTKTTKNSVTIITLN